MFEQTNGQPAIVHNCLVSLNEFTRLTQTSSQNLAATLRHTSDSRALYSTQQCRTASSSTQDLPVIHDQATSTEKRNLAVRKLSK